MNALLFLALTALGAAIAEFTLWTLFQRGVTPAHFAEPLAPRFLHVSKKSRMAILAGLHLLFTLGMLAVSYLLLW
jgi:hypothetical protein